MRVLVTGSSGQIGSYVVDELRNRGHEPVGLDLRPDEQWTEFVGDIRDQDLVQTASEGCDAVIHCAAQISVQASIEDPADDASHNVIGTIHLLEAARQHDVGRFVNVSSAAVYGEPEHLPIDEHHPTRPLAPYGQSKLAAEGYANLYHELHGLDVITVRPFNVYSPRQDPTNPYSGVMSKFAERVSEGEPPIVFGDGSQTRDLVHARDVARALAEIATHEVQVTAGSMLNLGTGNETTIRRLAEMFLDASGMSRTEPVHEDAREGEIDRSVSAVKRMQSVGIEMNTRLRDGVKELLG